MQLEVGEEFEARQPQNASMILKPSRILNNRKQ